jgi:hypothetical protein
MRDQPGPLFVPIAFATALIALASWNPLPAATIYVDDNTCPATGLGTLASPYCRIQDAVCIASSGDLVSVAPGTYLEAIRMKPNVSVISQGGAAVTTINSSGKPCTDSNFCAKKTSNQCTVVTFSTGHSPTTVLEGFTITGGQGQAVPAPLTNVVGGGGIYIFSSPTIRNNVIQNNVIHNVSPARGEFDGAGIYVSRGAPIITNNVITGNRAVPPAGTSGAVSYGYGGGIYISFVSTPQIIANTIQNNQAGDPNLAFSLGSGGGISIAEPDPNAPPGTTLVDRNLIADNVTDTFGGGVSLVSIPTSVGQSIVSNNVIIGNTTYRGGGLYTYLNISKLVNNTITNNTAQLGGGVFSGDSDMTLPIIVSNNVVTGNHLKFAGNGGGLYKLDLGTTPSTSLESNDIFGNDKNQVAGDPNDATFFSTNGNITLDPNYVNESARDYHVNPNSPVIDRALASRAPAVDKDDTARGFDGDGIPNYPMPGDDDIGAYEWRPTCIPSLEICDGIDNDCDGQVDEGNPGGGQACTTGIPGVCSAGTTACTSGHIVCNQNTQASAEVCDGIDNNCNGQVDENNPGGGGACSTGLPGVCSSGTRTCQAGSLNCVQSAQASAEACDGLDNNCNGLVDEGFPDTDGDGLADCIDPDIDDDGVLNASDCAPYDVTTWGVPIEVANVKAITSSPTTLTYDLQNVGSGTHYEIVSGLLSRTVVTRGFQEDFCVAAFTGGGSWQDPRPNPPVRNGWYYMIRDVNNCGASSYGTPLRNSPRSVGVCPTGIQDLDFDGSPSDLDCNDNDPTSSPLKTEVCDGRDNNCNGQVDENNPGGGGPCATGIPGVCSAGTNACLSGAIACVQNTQAATEICDGLDNNCNGQVDENNPGGGGACATGLVGVCSAGMMICQIGSLSCVQNTQASAETCDGLDNNCNGSVDEGFPDADADGLADCVDPDIDNDGVLNGADCAPSDATAFGVPVEIHDLAFLSGAPPQLKWSDQAIGSGTRYQIATGQIASMGSISFVAGTCLPSVASSPADVSSDPGVRSAYYYLVKPVNACGAGTYGSAARDTHPVCP